MNPNKAMAPGTEAEEGTKLRELKKVMTWGEVEEMPGPLSSLCLQ